MKRDDFLKLAQMADDALKVNAYIESRAAWTLIRTIARHAANRGQRPSPVPPPSSEQQASNSTGAKNG